MNKKVRLAVTGASGRMGRKLILVSRCTPEVILKAALVRKKSTLLNTDVGKLIGTENIGVVLKSNLKDIIEEFDVLIDFTNPDYTIENLYLCHQYRKSIVIGTTGFNKPNMETIRRLSKDIAIVISPNFSIGINLIFKLLRIITKIVGKDSDIKIIETHHKKKLDIPSGTALNMKAIIIDTLNKIGINKQFLYKKKSNFIKISAIRSGNTIGKHKVIFDKTGERIKIVHEVLDRTIFAIGAVQAAVWLKDYKRGIFDMMDILSF